MSAVFEVCVMVLDETFSSVEEIEQWRVMHSIVVSTTSMYNNDVVRLDDDDIPTIWKHSDDQPLSTS